MRKERLTWLQQEQGREWHKPGHESRKVWGGPYYTMVRNSEFILNAKSHWKVLSRNENVGIYLVFIFCFC